MTFMTKNWDFINNNYNQILISDATVQNKKKLFDKNSNEIILKNQYKLLMKFNYEITAALYLYSFIKLHEKYQHIRTLHENLLLFYLKTGLSYYLSKYFKGFFTLS